jgi:hypothetical protein
MDNLEQSKGRLKLTGNDPRLEIDPDQWLAGMAEEVSRSAGALTIKIELSSTTDCPTTGCSRQPLAGHSRPFEF